MKKNYIQPALFVSSLSTCTILAASGESGVAPQIKVSANSTLNESQMRGISFNNLAKSINNFIFDEEDDY